MRNEEASGSPVADAYQVFDRYLEEGRAFAQGRSAWFPGDAETPGATDWLGNLARMLEQLAQLAPNISDLSKLAPPGTVPIPPRPDTTRPQFHPAQRPDYPRDGDWEDWTTGEDSDPPGGSTVGGVGDPDLVNRGTGDTTGNTTGNTTNYGDLLNPDRLQSNGGMGNVYVDPISGAPPRGPGFPGTIPDLAPPDLVIDGPGFPGGDGPRER